MQTEINKMLEILLIIQNYYAIFEGRPPLDMLEHLIIDPFGREVPEFANDLGEEKCEKLLRIYEHTVQLVEKAIPHVIKSSF